MIVFGRFWLYMPSLIEGMGEADMCLPLRRLVVLRGVKQG